MRKEIQPTPLTRTIRIPALVFAYALVLFGSLALALLLRVDFRVPETLLEIFWISLLWMLPLKLATLALFGQFRSMLTFFSLPDAKRLAAAIGTSAFISLLVWFLFEGEHVLPRGVIVSDMIISFMGLVALRTMLRLYRERISDPTPSAHGKRRACIIGAGSSGAALLRDIQSRQGLGLEVVCFLDDNTAKIGSTLHGKPILGSRKDLPVIARDFSLQKVIIAMPGARPPVIKELVAQINNLGLEHEILPSVAQLLHGQVTVSHLRPVDPQDLLGRDPVALDEEGITGLIRGAVVMVTGAGGSIGSELCRQLAEQNPARLVLVERSEPALFVIEQELRAKYPHVTLAPCALNVCDEQPLDRLFATEKPSLVFHAAAHKHVPLMEFQPDEALRNNSLGTEMVARMADRHQAKKFVLISTDKAVNPTSVMGATKRLAEMVIKEYQTTSQGTCCYAAVRFGNVLGSSGSVVPTFRRQIAEGGPVTVTHPEVTRYFMSIPEAVGLILQSAYQAEGGEIFVLDMGEPVKIADLARQMIELSGLTPDEDIKIATTGLRPGEKLYEEPIHAKENVEPTIHPKVRKLRNNRGEATTGLVQELVSSKEELTSDGERVKQWLSAKVPEYTMWDGRGGQ